MSSIIKVSWKIEQIFDRSTALEFENELYQYAKRDGELAKRDLELAKRYDLASDFLLFGFPWDGSLKGWDYWFKISQGIITVEVKSALSSEA